jgi:hypothetical protein
MQEQNDNRTDPRTLLGSFETDTVNEEDEQAVKATPVETQFSGNEIGERPEISQEILPEIVDLSHLSAQQQEQPVKMAKFQHVNPGFFPQNKEPTLTINERTVSVNAAAVRLFPDVDYMEILINEEDQQVGFEPSDELNVRAYKWAREKGGKRYATQRSGQPFVLCICEIMGWDYNKRYKIRGKKVPSDRGEEILLFDLKPGHGVPKPAPGEKGNGRPTILTGWDGTFGPAYDEGGGSLHIDKFEKFAVFSLKKGWVQDGEKQTDAAEPIEGQSNSSPEGDGRENKA